MILSYSLKDTAFKDIHKSDPVDENTLFVIASCSKAFTTASLATLVDAGKLKWDDPVTKYLPDFQMYDPWVTKRDNGSRSCYSPERISNIQRRFSLAQFKL